MANESWINELDQSYGPETVQNPFTGATVELGQPALAIYDFIKGSEMVASIQDRQLGEVGGSEYWRDVRRGLDWFRANLPNAYYILLD